MRPERIRNAERLVRWRAVVSAFRRLFSNTSFAGLITPGAALALLAGALAVQALHALPPRGIDVSVAVVGLLSTLLSRRLRWLGLFLLAAGWTMWRADIALSQRLPHALEGQDILVTGVVRGLPQVEEHATRFQLDVQSARFEGKPIGLDGRARLSWYDHAPELQPCSEWQLRLRLKRPRALIDPGSFDFERFALQRGIVATGYVREDDANRVLGSAPICVDRLRQHIVGVIRSVLGPGPRTDLMQALAFGDQRAMDEHEWAVARATGIPHLIAISGLHIALFASFGLALIRLLWKMAPRITLRWPAPLIEAVASLVFAVAYALLAGFGLPTRRALVMIGALLLANLARRGRAPVQGLALAVIVLLIWNPLCVLSAGFWLSFVGVGWLMFCLGGATQRRRWLRDLVTAQGVASLGLLPLGIWFFGQSSLIGPVANLIAVPWICFLVLPLTVLGTLLALMVPSVGAPLLLVAGTAMQWLWTLLEKIAAWPGSLWYFPEPHLWALVLALLGALWLLLPRGIPARGLGLLLLLPLLWPARTPLAPGEFEAVMLDVGQGLSFVVRTRDHALVYDTGARYPSGFDLGDAAVVPTLHALGIGRLDRMIISHGDNDHAGGASAVKAAYPTVPVESGEPKRLNIPARQCLAGESWIWNGVRFRILHPREPLPVVNNDRSCVLAVTNAGGGLLLTGDITSEAEPDVTEAMNPVPSHLVLQVPHHGSKTSSGAGFLDALKPDLALVSSGYRNRFHHPGRTVVARYRERDIALLNSPISGFVDVHFSANLPPRVVERGRVDRHPYWRE